MKMHQENGIMEHKVIREGILSSAPVQQMKDNTGL